MTALVEKIDTDSILTEDMVDKWNALIPLLAEQYIDKTIEIPLTMANKYKFDMEGLFLELEMPIAHIYPHIRVNGYLSSSDYDGWKLRLDIIDYNVLDKYYKLFKRKKN